MKVEKSEKKQKEKQALLTFLKQAKEGKYAKIDLSSIPYSRLGIETYFQDEYYFFSIS